MKVILLKDVPKVGQKYDIKEVNDGYAINFLLPKKLAEAATPKLLAEIENRKKAIRIEKEVREGELIKNLAMLKGVTIKVRRKTNESGHLFSGLKKEEIVEELKKNNVDLSPEVIILDKPIKETGEFEIPVEVRDKKGKFKLVVEKL